MAINQLGDGSGDGVQIPQKVGFYGVSPKAQLTVAAAGTDAATTQTLANSLRTQLIALGLVKAA
jgi:hypothetical protein